MSDTIGCVEFLGRPLRRLLVPAAVGVVCVGVVVAALWLLSGFAGTARESTGTSEQQVSATVVKTADCANPSAHDTVSFTLAGQKHQASLNGCGNQTGQTVAVLVPVNPTDGTVVNPASTAPSDSSGRSRRVAFLLLVVATLAGGLCAYHLYLQRGHVHGRGHRPRRGKRRTSTPEPESAFAGVRAASTEITSATEPKNWFEDTSGLPGGVNDLPDSTDDAADDR